MPQPIKLTYAEVVEKGRKAYLAGELSAQGPTPACKYRDDSGRPCVIGAALSDEQARELVGPVGYLAREGVFEVRKTEEAALVELQNAHDQWASAMGDGDELTATTQETRLRKLLNIEEAA